MLKKRNLFRMLIGILILLIMIVTYDWERKHLEIYSYEGAVYRLYKMEKPPIKRVYKIGDNRIAQIVNVEGYKSEIELLVIINTLDSIVEKVIVLKEHESENYGEYIAEDWFLERFEKMGVDTFISIAKIRKEKDNEVVIVTGATVSSAAVLYGVNLCIEHYQLMIK